VSTVEFLVRRIGGEDGHVAVVVPLVDGTELATLVTDFEAAQGYEPAGGYDGVTPAFISNLEIARHLLGEPSDQGATEVLSCQCGEWGCWPLLASITVADGEVTWSAFAQPHRRDRDYRAFGPFRFDEHQYRAAVTQAAADLETFDA
jgi:hypothetical protein